MKTLQRNSSASVSLQTALGVVWDRKKTRGNLSSTVAVCFYIAANFHLRWCLLRAEGGREAERRPSPLDGGRALPAPAPAPRGGTGPNCCGRGAAGPPRGCVRAPLPAPSQRLLESLWFDMVLEGEGRNSLPTRIFSVSSKKKKVL